MTLSSKLILLAIACMYFSLVRNELKTLHIGCLHLFVQFSNVASYGERKCVRLACIRHAASVRPEPGSNSHKMY